MRSVHGIAVYFCLAASSAACSAGGAGEAAADARAADARRGTADFAQALPEGDARRTAAPDALDSAPLDAAAPTVPESGATDARPAPDASTPAVGPPPEVSVESPREGETTRGPEIALTGRTTGGEAPLQLEVNGTEFEVEPGPFSVAVPQLRPAAVTLRVIVRDALNRRDEARVRVLHNPLTLDLTAPEIRVDTPAEGAHVGADFLVIGQVVDFALPGAESTGVARLEIDGVEVPPPLSPFRLSRVEQGVPGASTVAVLTLVARDGAGNEANLQRAFEIDRAPPAITLREPVGIVYDDTLSVTVEAEDPAGIDAVWLEGLAGGRMPLALADDGTYQGVLLDWPTGPAMLDVSASDRLGNEVVVSFPVQRESPVPDRTPPQLVVTAPQPFTEVDAPVLVRGTLIDSAGHPGERPSGAVRVTVDGQTGAPDPEGGFSLPWNGPAGPHVIEVTGEDAAGNVVSARLGVHMGPIPADADAPVLTLEAPADGVEAFGEPIVLTGSLTDARSGPRAVRAGGRSAPVIEGRFELLLAGFPPGENTLEVVGDDWAGNEVAVARRFLRRPPLEGGTIAFTNVTETTFAPDELPAAGGDTAGAGIGAAVSDFDGDGDPDVITAGTHNGLYPAQQGAAYFENTTLPGGEIRLERRDAAFDPPIDALEVYAIAYGDADGDGHDDVYLGCDGQDRLYGGDGQGHFADLTLESGLPDWAGRTVQAAFVDFDLDGWDDLYVSGFPTEDAARRSYAGVLPYPPRTRLLMNRGGGRFEDIAPAAGVVGELVSTHASLIFDLDGDGDLDIYDANDVFTQGGTDQIWVQSPNAGGDPRFEGGRAAWGLDDETYRMGAALADIDLDGRPELYLTDVDPKRLYDLWEGLPLVDRAPALGIQQPRRDDPGRPGRTEALWGWDAHFTDFDRDGFPDLFLVNGSVASAYSRTIFFQNPYVFRNREGHRFDDVTEAAGLHEIAPFNADLADGLWFRGASPGDFDSDGDRDLLLSAMLGPFRMLRNDSRTIGHALRLQLRGTVTGPSAVGALVTATADAWTHTGFQSAGGHTRSTPEPILEIPLGAVQRLETVEIRWPGGLRQRLEPLPAWDTVTPVLEPRWLALDPTEAAASAPVSYVLRWPEAVARVEVTLDGATLLAVRDPAGVYRTTLTAPARPGRFPVTTALDGQPLPARPHLTVR